MTKKKKRKIRFGAIILIILFIYLIVSLGYYLFTLPIKNIIVQGNSLISEKEIISTINIKSNMPLIKVNNLSLQKKLKKNIPLIHNIKIKKNILGTLTITIEENKILFYDLLNSNYVLSDGTTSINDNYFGYPVLINYVPNSILNKFITKYKNIDLDIILMISEIEYNPDVYGDITVDEERFIFRMNDGNTIYINTVNMEKMNKYQTIYSSIEGKGILYLDSSSKNYIFKTYGNDSKGENEGNEN